MMKIHFQRVLRSQVPPAQTDGRWLRCEKRHICPSFPDCPAGPAHPPSSSSHNSAYIHNLSTPYAKMQSAHTLFCYGWISSHEFWQMLICLTLTDKRSKDIPGRWFVTRKWLLLPVIVESPTAFYIFNHLQLFRSCHADKDSQTSRYWWTKQWLCFSFFPVSSSFERECFP